MLSYLFTISSFDWLLVAGGGFEALELEEDSELLGSSNVAVIIVATSI
tara:strand:+ start:474 stop:617 length:144 start_codon:yes stop_codon:yes gene_type:complete